MFRFLAIALMAIGLAACPGKVETRVVTNSINTQPLGVTLPKPAPLTLLPVDLDAPRDMKSPVANPEYADCLATPIANMDATTYKRCVIYPIAYETSNIYRGFTRDDYKNWQVNMARIDSHIKALTLIIDTYNAKVIKDNERIKQENAAAAQPTPTPNP